MNESPASNGLLLSAAEVTRVFHVGHTEVRALRGVTLDIAEGDTVAIMGASGAGKSTLLHTLGGLERPSSGTVCFRGRDLYGLSARERCAIRADRFGFVFQTYHLLPELTVLENVMLPAMTHAPRRGRAEPGRRARELLERVGLSARAEHRPAELSGGEQQRVALARALMNAPEVILADEPTGNLDSATGQQILDHLFTLAREGSHTLVLVTHNEAVARQCRRSFVLHDGRLAL